MPQSSTSSPHAFTVLRRSQLPSGEGEYIHWTHPSGAQLLHFATPDSCRVFSASFYTPPPDDSGVTHVLEHLALCGSREYPSDQPFFKAQGGSPRDYMNASTTRDWTAYTFASRVQSDYWRLLDLYLDACFHPLLRDHSFAQEAWRVEDGTYQGVVFNEMSGALAHSARVMRDLVGRALFPGTPYSRNSGGDPEHLVGLSPEAVRTYHRQHYTASNACFYSSGDLDPLPLLIRLDAALKDVPVGKPVPRPALRPAPLRRLDHTHPGGDQVLLAWATSPPADSLEHFALTVLSFALLGHAGAPLHQALSRHGAGLAEYSGFHSETPQGVFAIGVRGSLDEQAIETTVMETLQTELDDTLIEAALTRFELEDLDLSHGAAPYGVRRLFNAVSAYHHGADPCALSRLEPGIRALRALPDRTAYFRQLIQEHLLLNDWRTTIVMRSGPAAAAPRPPSGQQAKGNGPEPTCAPGHGADLEPGHVASVKPFLNHLEALPALEAKLEALMGLPIPAWQVSTPQAGLTYLTLSGPLDHLSAASLPLAALYGTLVSRSSVQGQLLTAQLQSWGAMSHFSVDTHHAPHDSHQVQAEWTLSLKVLSKHLPQVVGLLRRWAQAPQFGQVILEQSLEERLRSFETLLVAQGHNLALLQAALGVSPALGTRDALDGWGAHQQLRRWQADPELDHALEALHQQLWCQPGLTLLAVSDLPSSALEEALGGFIAELPSTRSSCFPLIRRSAPAHVPPQPDPHLWTHELPIPVASGAWAFAGVPYLHADAPGLTLLSRVLHERLHTQLRQQGGAYGATCRAAAEQGLLLCASVRDPDIGRSLQVFQSLPALLEPLTPDDLNRARISAVRLLRPLTSLPGAARKAFIDARHGYTPVMRDAFYRRVTQTQADELPGLADRYLHGGAGAVLASADALSALSQNRTVQSLAAQTSPFLPNPSLPNAQENPHVALA